MPELPDLTIYAERIEALAGGQTLRAFTIDHPFVLRTVTPAPRELLERPLAGVRRIGKRLALQFGREHFALIHLMRAGRLRWVDARRKTSTGGRGALARWRFDAGTLLLTEAGTRRRAALHLASGKPDVVLPGLDAGGLEPLDADRDQLRDRLLLENHTLKRALTDPRLLAGIGGAYADEIMHRAGLSPLALTQRFSPDEFNRLHAALRAVLGEWLVRLRAQAAALPDELPQVTAFRPEMAVHGKFGQPCPVCGARIQRIVYADRETDYCPGCQTDGRILADRALSRLLKASFPASLEDLEL